MKLNHHLKCLVGSLLGAGIIVLLFSPLLWHAIGFLGIKLGAVLSYIYHVGILGLCDVFLNHKALSAFIIFAVFLFLICTTLQRSTPLKNKVASLFFITSIVLCLILLMIFFFSILSSITEKNYFKDEYITAQKWMFNIDSSTRYPSFKEQCESDNAQDFQKMYLNDYVSFLNDNDSWANPIQDKNKPLVFYCQNELTFYYNRNRIPPFSRDVYNQISQRSNYLYHITNAFVLNDGLLQSLKPDNYDDYCDLFSSQTCSHFGNTLVITDAKNPIFQLWNKTHVTPANQKLVAVVSIESKVDFFGEPCRDMVRHHSAMFSQILINGHLAKVSACQPRTNLLTYIQGIYQEPNILQDIHQKKVSTDKDIDKEAQKIAQDLSNSHEHHQE